MYQKIRMPLICGFASIASVILAVNNEQGLIIQNTWELGPTGATAFYWGSALVFFAIAAFTAPRFKKHATASESRMTAARQD